MYEFFYRVARIRVPDYCKTVVVHHGDWEDQLSSLSYWTRRAAQYYYRTHVGRLVEISDVDGDWLHKWETGFI